MQSKQNDIETNTNISYENKDADSMTSMSRKEMNGKLLRKAGIFYAGVAQFEKGLGRKTVLLPFASFENSKIEFSGFMSYILIHYTKLNGIYERF